MIVEVITGAAARPEARVADVDDLVRLHLALGVVADEQAARALEHEGLGRLRDAETAVLEVAALHAAAQPRSTASDWQAGWDEMIDKARSQDWLSEDDAERQVHIERDASG